MVIGLQKKANQNYQIWKNLQPIAHVFDYIGLREARPDSEKNSTDPRFAAGLYLFQNKVSTKRSRWLAACAAQRVQFFRRVCSEQKEWKAREGYPSSTTNEYKKEKKNLTSFCWRQIYIQALETGCAQCRYPQMFFLPASTNTLLQKCVWS